jgi:hypothetical protein
MAPKSWVWAYFYMDGKKYKNSKTDPNAWCNACLFSRMADLRESDSVAAANGLLAHGRSEDELKAGYLTFLSRVANPIPASFL